MSEDIGAWIREQRFGHIVAQTGIGEVFSLDLFETPDLVCRGFYLPGPPFLRRDVPRDFSEHPSRPLPLPEVELRARSDVMAELERSSSIIRQGDDDQRSFAARGRRFDEVRGAINLVSRQQEAEVWTGVVRDDSPGPMSFVLERYGSPEIILLIVMIFLLLHMDRRADELDEACRRIAFETCGERRVKRYRVYRTLPSLAESEGFSHDCEIECM